MANAKTVHVSLQDAKPQFTGSEISMMVLRSVSYVALMSV